MLPGAPNGQVPVTLVGPVVIDAVGDDEDDDEDVTVGCGIAELSGGGQRVTATVLLRADVSACDGASAQLVGNGDLGATVTCAPTRLGRAAGRLVAARRRLDGELGGRLARPHADRRRARAAVRRLRHAWRPRARAGQRPGQRAARRRRRHRRRHRRARRLAVGRSRRRRRGRPLPALAAVVSSTNMLQRLSGRQRRRSISPARARASPTCARPSRDGGASQLDPARTVAAHTRTVYLSLGATDVGLDATVQQLPRPPAARRRLHRRRRPPAARGGAPRAHRPAQPRLGARRRRGRGARRGDPRPRLPGAARPSVRGDGVARRGRPARAAGARDGAGQRGRAPRCRARRRPGAGRASGGGRGRDARPRRLRCALGGQRPLAARPLPRRRGRGLRPEGQRPHPAREARSARRAGAGAAHGPQHRLPPGPRRHAARRDHRRRRAAGGLRDARAGRVAVAVAPRRHAGDQRPAAWPSAPATSSWSSRRWPAPGPRSCTRTTAPRSPRSPAPLASPRCGSSWRPPRAPTCRRWPWPACAPPAGASSPTGAPAAPPAAASCARSGTGATARRRARA